jgi:hypothetical protein
MSTEGTVKHLSGFGTRLFAFGALAGFVGLFGYGGHQAYRAVTDSFVAPAILSPDSDLVLQSKVKIAELDVERTRSNAELEAIDADVSACDAALARLGKLKSSAGDALAWTAQMTKGQAATARTDLRMLERQKSELADMTAKQAELVERAKENLAAGLVTRGDLDRETQALAQLRVAAIENARTALQTSMALRQASLAQESLGRSGSAPPLPEAILREDQLVRIELEILKLEAEKRVKLAERRVTQAKLAKLDEVEAQLRGRPVFRATEKALDVAFVPYTQIEGVGRGAKVYDCTWGLFNCKPVGAVAELVPGEVILPDPWGNQARGQYAVLELSDRESAKSKILRVRTGGSSSVVPRDRDALSAR